MYTAPHWTGGNAQDIPYDNIHIYTGAIWQNHMNKSNVYLIMSNNCASKSFLFNWSDLNECAEADQGGCQQGCTNEDGGFACFCGSGFILDSDGKTCDGKSPFHMSKKENTK